LKIMIFAGEPSGDYYGANLLKALQSLNSSIEAFGFGSQQMKKAGFDVIFDPTELSVVGITEALKQIGFFRSWLKRLEVIMKERKPDCVVLIDFPGFNMRVAKLAKKLKIPVVYFIPPSAWAWGKKRAYKVAETVDKVASILPMELEVYRNAGADIVSVGHPLLLDIPGEIDRSKALKELGLSDSSPVLALLPGSRKQEIGTLYAPMLEACKLLKKDFSDLQVILGLSPAIKLETIEEINREVGFSPLVFQDQTHKVIAASTVCLCAGGTVTLETALLKRPMVVVYKLSKITFFFVKRLVTVKYYSLPNLVLNKRVVPELIQNDCTAENMASELKPLLSDPRLRVGMVDGLAKVRLRLQGEGGAEEGAYVKTAKLVLEVAKGAGSNYN